MQADVSFALEVITRNVSNQMQHLDQSSIFTPGIYRKLGPGL